MIDYIYKYVTPLTSCDYTLIIIIIKFSNIIVSCNIYIYLSIYIYIYIYISIYIYI